MRRAGGETWVGIGLVALIVWLSLLPLVRLAVAALSSHGAFVSPALVRALGHSMVTSLGGSAIAILFGGAYAGAVVLTDMPCRRLLAAAALLPLLIPAQIIALAWMQTVSPAGLLSVGHGTALFSPSGIILLLGVEHVPIVFLALSAALPAIPTELFETARADGARAARLVCRIVLPLSAPGLAAAFGLAALSSLGSFGIPARYPTLAVLIYQRLSGFGTAALPDVAAMALCLAAIAALVARATALVGRGVDMRGLGGAASSGYRIELGAWRFALLQGSHWLVRVALDLENVIELEIAHRGEPPAAGARLGLSVLDGWVVPDR
jgi:iron(III) transport system permease protein